MTEQVSLEQNFQRHFGFAPSQVVHGPGRVNLIGDHTDYNDGFVLPAAINFGTDIAAAKRGDRMVKVVAADYDNDTCLIDLDAISFDKDKMWANYISGTLQCLMTVYPNLSGAELVVSGNVPQGAGLSSSASFEIAILKTFASLYDLPLDGVKAALLGQKAENEFVGCNCGIMDQLVSAMGNEGNAMLLDCRDLSIQHAPIPSNMSLVIVNSNVKRGLVDSEYNTRREQCEQVAKFFNVAALRDVSLSMLESAEQDIEPTLYQRAKHVVTENDRTERALTALKANDMKTMSALMAQSHISLKDDFAVTTPEMDYLVEIIGKELGENGGVRMTGGGFGGCVVALTPSEQVAQVKAVIAELYQDKTGLTADVYVCQAKNGAFA